MPTRTCHGITHAVKSYPLAQGTNKTHAMVLTRESAVELAKHLCKAARETQPGTFIDVTLFRATKQVTVTSI